MTFATIIWLLIEFIIAGGICYLVYRSVLRLPFSDFWRNIVLAVLGLLLALLLAQYFFGSGSGFPHFHFPR